MLGRRTVLGGLGAAAAGGLALADDAGELAGVWSGVLDAGGQKLRLKLEIGADGSATLVSVDQGGARIPARVERSSGAEVEIAAPAVGGRYRARRVDDRLEGTWSQGGATLPLVMARGEAAATAAPPPAEPLTEAALEAFRTAAGAPGMAAAAERRGGATRVWTDGEREFGSGRLVGTGDSWHLGSITKSMTATLCARLVEAGLLRWDETVGERLGFLAPEMRDAYRKATLQHLLSHRAGLPANIPVDELVRFPREEADARESRRAYARRALSLAPEAGLGERMIYSNNGYVLAGLMIEEATGAAWETAIRERLFEPLNLASAGFGAPSAADNPVGHAADLLRGVKAYRPGEGVTDNPAVLGPAGRVHMSLQDLVKYLAAHRDRAGLLSAESWRVLHAAPFGGDYALGWIVRGDGSLWHNGSNTLWYAEAAFHPAQGWSAAAAANDGRLGTAAPAVGRALAGAAAAV
jgi:CubicO group peptidase (beta-lactamase class C family)